MTTSWIAEQDFLFVHPDGRRCPGRVAVSAPTASGAEAHCTVVLEGLLPHEMTMMGATTLHCLFLALWYLQTTLKGFLEKGWRVLDPVNEKEVPVAALFGLAPSRR
jgi:hypothetical protein